MLRLCHCLGILVRGDRNRSVRSMLKLIPARPSVRVFLSYRRGDTSGHAGRLRADIERLLPGSRVFMDISAIRPGEDFANAIQTAIASCNLFLVLIGRGWLSLLREDSADQEQEDWARVELRNAIDHKIPIVPVLVDRASLPEIKELPEDLRDLARRQAIEISESRWDFDVSRLIEVIKQTTHGSGKQRWWYKLAGAIGLTVLLGFLAVPRFCSQPQFPKHEEPIMIAAKPTGASAKANSRVVDYSKVDTLSAPHSTVSAAPYLHDFGITVTSQIPPESQVVLVNNLTEYNGEAIRPTTSQNFLTQIRTDNAPASFTLKFSEPLDSVEFVIPAFYPTSESGVTHPAWSAHALDVGGRELSSLSEGITRSSSHDVPSHHYLLRVPGLDGIVAVRFDSDPRLNGKPFAGFNAILIEQLTLTPKVRE